MQHLATKQGSVHQAFVESARRWPGHDFLCLLPETARKYDIEARTYSYAQAAAMVADLGQRYRAAGVQLGQRVGIMLENRPAFFFHWLALNALGASVVPINPDWRSAELEYLVGHSEICIAVVPRARVEELRRAGVSAGRSLVVTTPELAALESVAGKGDDAGTAEPGVDTECALLYTSGTTGRPKGCVLPNEYFLYAGCWYAQLGGLCCVEPGKERLITPLPMSHMNAMACSTMVMLMTGGCIIPLDRFHPGSWWEGVRQSRATIVHYLGVMPAMLLGAPGDTRDRTHCVRFGFGAGVSPRLHASFEQRFGFPLIEAWAMTETGVAAAVIANHEPRKIGTACFGRAPATLEYRVVDDVGADAIPGDPGELWVRRAGDSPRFGFFREYLKDPPATQEAWADGYFHTGDIVSVDADGDFHFIDRKKNVIRRSGENISAVEVEGVLLQHPDIAGAGVTAVPDEVRGDEVMACVVLRAVPADSDRERRAREILNFCLERLAYYKAPGYVTFCSSLPLTPTEKIQRARLKDLGRSLLAQAGCVDLRSLKKRSTVG